MNAFYIRAALLASKTIGNLKPGFMKNDICDCLKICSKVKDLENFSWWSVYRSRQEKWYFFFRYIFDISLLYKWDAPYLPWIVIFISKLNAKRCECSTRKVNRGTAPSNLIKIETEVAEQGFVNKFATVWWFYEQNYDVYLAKRNNLATSCASPSPYKDACIYSYFVTRFFGYREWLGVTLGFTSDFIYLISAVVFVPISIKDNFLMAKLFCLHIWSFPWNITIKPLC